jgi:hypothetical protein
MVDRPDPLLLFCSPLLPATGGVLSALPLLRLAR